MLKIKDDLPLEILKDRFGFVPLYDEYTGEIREFYKITRKGLERYGLHFIKQKTKLNIIRIATLFSPKERFKREGFYIDENILWCHKNYNAYEFDFDTLYDLIKADLVEKV